ncbi:methionine--tRNA ligase [Nocardia salmonicida]|uniref:methionine--tRNA ligase n=1 Tax=Nocardia salmonicida TaxID=53431 RepID=UPI00362BE05D
MIEIDDFTKIDIRVGTVVECTEIAGSHSILRLTVDFGDGVSRTVLSGLKKLYSPADLLGYSFAFIVNLRPRVMMGQESQGMMLTIESDPPALLPVSPEIAPGSRLL